MHPDTWGAPSYDDREPLSGVPLPDGTAVIRDANGIFADSGATPWKAADAALNTALAIFRHPAHYGELLRGCGELSTDAVDIIRYALEASRQTGRADDETPTLAAALFFVRHVLLADAADHYRILGLPQDCPPADIRQHYRLMMSLFHPDRAGWAEDDREPLAARINQAYRILRDPESRAEYDRELDRPRAVFPPHIPRQDAAAAYQPLAPTSRPPGQARIPPRPFVMHHRVPQTVMGLAATMGMALVLSVYLDRPASLAIGMDTDHRGAPMETFLSLLSWPKADDDQYSSVLADAIDAPIDEGAKAEFELDSGSVPRIPPATIAMRESSPSPPQSQPVAAAPEPKAAAPKPVAAAPEPKAAAPKPVAAAPEPKAAAPKPVVAAPEPKAAAPKPVAAAPEPKAAAPKPVVAAPEPKAAAPKTPDPASIDAITRQDAEQTLRRFFAAYRHGDLNQFMTLFSPDAKSSSGGLRKIRSDYERLFQKTGNRSFEFGRVSWRINGPRAVAEGRFSVQVIRIETSQSKKYTGSLRFELIKVKGEVLIQGFFHQLDP